MLAGNVEHNGNKTLADSLVLAYIYIRQSLIGMILYELFKLLLFDSRGHTLEFLAHVL